VPHLDPGLAIADRLVGHHQRARGAHEGERRTSQIIITKELGLGTAAAVLIDASIIRALLVPALMQLLGRWNWWAPAPLRRLHARIRFSEA
jgi:RND superfamily putative drug exporter